MIRSGRIGKGAALAVAVIAVIELSGYFVLWREAAMRHEVAVPTGGAFDGPAGRRRTDAMWTQRIRDLAPKDTYVVIDTARNHLFLMEGSRIVRRAVVSCGSGSVLKEPGGKRRWIFDTPRGEFRVQAKLRNPYWVKPDWAFIEEGKTIPAAPGDRIEAGALGEYAIGFGNGYFIHGTMYSRLLGRNITHGCIRVGDDDLKAVYAALSVGDRLFIF